MIRNEENKNEQNAAQVNQQQAEEKLESFMLSAKNTFDNANGFNDSKLVPSTPVWFKMGGV